MKALLAETFRPFVDDGVVPGIAAGVIGVDGHAVSWFGSSGKPRPLDAETLFDVGSVTKTYTALLLAELVAEGRVRLEDPLSSFIPGASSTTTLLHLATHTAGLPRMPPSLEAADSDPANPYALFTADRLAADLAALADAAPTDDARSSNFGYASLAHALAAAMRSPIEDLLRERVLKPLGLRSTTARPERESARCAQGHRDGRPVPDWDRGAIVGAGGVWSTPVDLLTYVRCLLRPEATKLAGALRETMTPRAPMGERARVGLAWVIVPAEPTLVWHNGGSGGFGAIIAFAPDAEAGCFAVYNGAHDETVDAACFALLRRLVG